MPGAPARPFEHRGGELHAEGVPLAQLAERFGTPLYVYSLTELLGRLRALRAAFGEPEPLVAYSVKANPNLAVVRALAREGAGADVVSVGELERALRAGVPPERIVFAGVGKREDELARALEVGVLQLNVEGEGELELLARLARARGVRAPVALRVNPDVVAGGHRYIQVGARVNKFGVPLAEARALYRRAAALDGLELRGVACHIGSQLLDLTPLRAALARVRELVLALREDGVALEQVDVGGGLGVRYRDEEPPALDEYAAAVREAVGDLGARLVLEPGRAIAANAGLLLTRVLYRKQSAGKRFLVADAAMNDLLRPALYQAHHEVLPVREDTPLERADLVGPICETGDFLAQDRDLPAARPGDLLAVLSAGAYARSMASNYNTRPRAAEVLVRGEEAFLIQERETLADLWARERIPDFLS